MWAGGDQVITQGTPGSSAAEGVCNRKDRAFRNEMRKRGCHQGGHQEEEGVVLVSRQHEVSSNWAYKCGPKSRSLF